MLAKKPPRRSRDKRVHTLTGSIGEKKLSRTQQTVFLQQRLLDLYNQLRLHKKRWRGHPIIKRLRQHIRHRDNPAPAAAAMTALGEFDTRRMAATPRDTPDF
jgi:hypothetical protein